MCHFCFTNLIELQIDMEQEYLNALNEQTTLECNTYGQALEINGNKINAIVSTSATTQKLQVAGFYKNQVLDVIAPLYGETPKLNQMILFNQNTYQVRQVEKMEYNTGHRLTIELVT